MSDTFGAPVIGIKLNAISALRVECNSHHVQSNDALNLSTKNDEKNAAQ